MGQMTIAVVDTMTQYTHSAQMFERLCAQQASPSHLHYLNMNDHRTFKHALGLYRIDVFVKVCVNRVGGVGHYPFLKQELDKLKVFPSESASQRDR